MTSHVATGRERHLLVAGSSAILARHPMHRTHIHGLPTVVRGMWGSWRGWQDRMKNRVRWRIVVQSYLKHFKRIAYEAALTTCACACGHSHTVVTHAIAGSRANEDAVVNHGIPLLPLLPPLLPCPLAVTCCGHEPCIWVQACAETCRRRECDLREAEHQWSDRRLLRVCVRVWWWLGEAITVPFVCTGLPRGGPCDGTSMIV